MVEITGLASTALEFIRNAFSTVKHYIKEVGVYVKDVGRAVLKYGYEIAVFFGDPAKGVPTAMALYLGSKYIRVDVNDILRLIDVTKDKSKEIRFAETVDEWIKSWLASWLDIDPTLPYWQIMNPMVVWQGLYNAPWAPHWSVFGVDFAVLLLAIIFVPIYIFIAILGAVIAVCYLLQWLYYLLVDFAFTVLRHLVLGFAWIINTVVDFVGFVSCNYLKLMMPAIPVLMAMRFAGKGRGMLTGAVVGTLATWVAVTAFTPECSIFRPAEFVTPKPIPPEVYVIAITLQVVIPELQRVVGDVMVKVVTPKLQRVVGDVMVEVVTPEVWTENVINLVLELQRVVGDVMVEVVTPEVWTENVINLVLEYTIS